MTTTQIREKRTFDELSNLQQQYVLDQYREVNLCEGWDALPISWLCQDLKDMGFCVEDDAIYHEIEQGGEIAWFFGTWDRQHVQANSIRCRRLHQVLAAFMAKNKLEHFTITDRGANPYEGELLMRHVRLALGKKLKSHYEWLCNDQAVANTLRRFEMTWRFPEDHTRQDLNNAGFNLESASTRRPVRRLSGLWLREKAKEYEIHDPQLREIVSNFLKNNYRCEAFGFDGQKADVVERWGQEFTKDEKDKMGNAATRFVREVVELYQLET